jgi:hypothetical protein
MAVSVVVSRPDDFGSAYVPAEYTFTSTFAGVSGTIGNIYQDTNGITIVVVNVSNPRQIFEGGKMTISNTTSGLYDGEWTVLSDRGTRGGLVKIDAPFVGNVTGGNMTYTRLNTHMICDLYIDGSFVVRKSRFPDANDQFVFDFHREVQTNLGNDMKPMPLGTNPPAVNSEGSVSIYVKYADVRDLITNGVPVQTTNLDTSQTPPDLYSDSANPREIVNATVPYLEWELGSVRSEIINKDTDLSSFIIDTGTNRFLTNAPKSITIGQDDSYQLDVAIDYDAGKTYRRRVRAYDSTGAQSGSDSFQLMSVGADSVWSVPCGTRELPLTHVPADATSYDVTITDTTTPISETITFNIDSNCYGSSTRFVWLNPRGGYDAYTFHSPRKLKSQVKTKTYKPARVYPVVVGNREEAILDVDARDTISTGTHKVNKETAEWLQELIESPQVFIELNSDNALHDKRVPVTLVNRSRSIVDSYNGAFNVNVSYRFAYEKIGIRSN